MDDTGVASRGDVAGRADAAVLARHRLDELEAIIAAIPDGVYVGDASGIRYCNRAALDMLGYASTEELNRHVATLMDELDARRNDGSPLPVEDNVFVRALRGESAAMDIIVRHRVRGEDRVLRSSAAPIRSGGRIIGAVAVNVDVTEDRRAEDELRTRRALAELEREVLALVAEGAPIAVVLHGLAVGLEHLSQPGLLASVLLVDEGRIRHVAAPSLPPAWTAAIEGAPIGPWAGSCGTAAYRGQRVIVADIATDPLWDDYREGALAHGLRACWSEPIADADGDVLGTVALYYREPREPDAADLTIIDGTARVARIALERHRAERARERAERAREAAHAELRETVHHLELLVGILGHDLRNPLTAIVTSTEVLLRRATDAQERTLLGNAVSSGRRMTRMIDQLLDLSRTRSSHRLPISRAAIDLAAVVRGVVAETEVAFGREIVVDLAGDTRGHWDGDRLAQATSNLLANACQHGDRGGPIRLRLHGDDDLVTLSVHNQGAIEPTLLPHLFELYSRGAAHPERAGGLGLGLYITRQIALAHGGDVTVASAPADGTIFRLILPRTASA